MQKCYNILFTGNVQDVGFRGLVENIARSYNLIGFVFNDIDGSVKMFCCCENGIVEDFLAEIKNKSRMHGNEIVNVSKEEKPFKPYLPHGFYRLQTDEMADVGRKLDKGNKELENIGNILGSVDNLLGSIDRKFDILNDNITIFTKEQRGHSERMDEHNVRLEKILEKLSEK